MKKFMKKFVALAVVIAMMVPVIGASANCGATVAKANIEAPMIVSDLSDNQILRRQDVINIVNLLMFADNDYGIQLIVCNKPSAMATRAFINELFSFTPYHVNLDDGCGDITCVTFSELKLGIEAATIK